MARCYEWVTVVNGEYVLLGYVKPGPFMVYEAGGSIVITEVRRVEHVKVSDIIGKRCITRRELPRVAKMLRR